MSGGSDKSGGFSGVVIPEEIIESDQESDLNEEEEHT